MVLRTEWISFLLKSRARKQVVRPLRRASWAASKPDAILSTSSRGQAGRLLNAVGGEEGVRREVALGLPHAYELLPPGL